MKSFYSFFLLFGFVFLHSCTNRCCPDETSILDIEFELPVDSMPTKYWFKQNGDSVLVDFGLYLRDNYFFSADYKVECNFYEIHNSETCESFTEVKTYTLTDSVFNYVIQFHYYPYRYYDAEHLRVANKIRLTLRSQSFKKDLRVFENSYIEKDYNVEEKITSEINRNKVKSVDYSLEKGLMKLELHEGLVIYAAD